ncbi:bactofilin family protein [Aurantiacibacter xanthus]|uniref:bactofilin family protein n=1 Tax=Aurantiacibacter xanthus TaxID=1784712 RepID=UPI001FE2F13E|nr:polymer-forming cytoskeletal protein [Aurantiacibacter xanthus]
MASSGTFSVFGPDVTIHGNVEASVDLHVDGSVIGDIACASLVQGEGSRIEGEVKAQSARLAGTVEGRIDAVELVILKTARILGDVSYETLTIEQGAQVNGRFAPHGANLAAGNAQVDVAPLPGADSDQMLLPN